MRNLNEHNIEHIAIGATVLGCGGGGDPYVGKLMAVQAIRENNGVSLISPDMVPDDALIAPVAMLGAPTVLIEKIPNLTQAESAFAQFKEFTGKEIFATMPLEVGGFNSMIPIALAAALNIPVVDADGMGRAFPRMEMVTFTLGNIQSSPMIVLDEKGNSLIINTIDNDWSEKIARVLAVAMGGAAMVCAYPLTGKQLKQWAVKDTLSLAEKFGKLIHETKPTADKELVLKKEYGAKIIFRGKIENLERRLESGWSKGSVVLQGLDEWKKQTMNLYFQNEFLAATTGDQVVASVPDLITVLDLETLHPLTTDAIKYGFRVVVVAFPANSLWLSKEGLSLGGPAKFGYNFSYAPF